MRNRLLQLWFLRNLFLAKSIFAKFHIVFAFLALLIFAKKCEISQLKGCEISTKIFAFFAKVFISWKPYTGYTRRTYTVKTGLGSLYRFESYHHDTFKRACPVVCLSVYFFRVSGNQMRLLTPTLYRSQMAGARQSLSMDCSGEENQTGEWERTNRNQYTTFTIFQIPKIP